MSYRAVYQRSVEEPEAFWSEAAAALDWVKAPTVIFDATADGPQSTWFADGELNTCFNALDRHVDSGAGQRTALIHDSPVTGTQRTFTYAELRDRAARLAGALAGLGVQRGDRVVIYMPMIPDAVAAMLACARLGAVHSVVFAGFAARELALRIDDAQPRVVLAASCGIEPRRTIGLADLLDQALDLTRSRPEHVLLLQRPEGPATMRHATLDWEEQVAAAEPADCVPVNATDPLYILYTSGTTGGPKGVVRDNGGHATALTWTMRNLYDVGPGDTFWAASDIGWVVGHSYIVYAPLLAGCATVLYEGKPVGTPDAGAFWRVIGEHRVRTLFTAPTALRAIRGADPGAALLAPYDISCLRHAFLAGERLDVDTLTWAQTHLPVDITDHWWQTETGWAITANPRGIESLAVAPGSAGVAMPGFRVRVTDARGTTLPAGEEGIVVVDRPLPPGTLTGLWRAPERFVKGYFSAIPGAYVTGDGGYITDDGRLFILGRSDDVMNVAGHRLSTAAIEEVVAGHPAVAECAVVGAHDELKGQMPVVLVVTVAGADIDDATLRSDIIALIREQVGAIAAPRTVTRVTRLPKTRSGKILRTTLRSIADGREFTVPATIEEPLALDEAKLALGPDSP